MYEECSCTCTSNPSARASLPASHGQTMPTHAGTPMLAGIRAGSSAPSPSQTLVQGIQWLMKMVWALYMRQELTVAGAAQARRYEGSTPSSCFPLNCNLVNQVASTNIWLRILAAVPSPHDRAENANLATIGSLADRADSLIQAFVVIRRELTQICPSI